MKKTLLTLAVSAIAVLAQAQMPQTFGYQAAIRNAEGELLKNQAISARITIYYVPQLDTVVYYQETHAVTTDNFGVATINIMGGTKVVDKLEENGGFAHIIDISIKPEMKIEIDPAGGSNYTLKSSAKLLPVPYAVYAEESKTANEAKQAISANSATTATTAATATNATTADTVKAFVGDMPLVNVTVKVIGVAASNGYVNFLGKTISVGSEMTFKLPAYNPVYISKIAVGNDGTHLFRRSVKLNNTTVNLPIKGQQYISTSTTGTQPKVPVRTAASDENVYIAENGSATTINGESMKPLYGTTKNQNDSQFASAYDNEENVLYVELPNYTISYNNYDNNEDIPNVLVGPFDTETNTIEIEYTQVQY